MGGEGRGERGGPPRGTCREEREGEGKKRENWKREETEKGRTYTNVQEEGLMKCIALFFALPSSYPWLFARPFLSFFLPFPPFFFPSARSACLLQW